MSNFSKISKSIGLLEQLSCDLNNLYCFTKDSRIEKLFIKVAESNENEIQEFLNLLYDGKFKKLNHLKNVINALKNLQDSPEGLSPSEFVNYSLNKFPSSVPTIICLSQLRNLNLPILYPLSKKLALTGHFQKGKDEEVESVLKELTVINNELQNFLKSKAETEYEDELVAKQPKQTRKEKIRTMTMFLLDRFGDEVTSGFQNSHLSSIASQVGGSLRNPKELLMIIPNASNINFNSLAEEAVKISREVIKRIEPHDFDSNYSFIKGKVLQFANKITTEQFNEYYQSVLMRDLNKIYGSPQDNKDEIKELNIKPSAWTDPTAIIFLSFILWHIAFKSI